MRSLPRLAAAVLAVSWIASLASCAGSPPGAGQGDDCSAKRTSAIDRVSKVIADNTACASDADCVTVAFGNSCFDACTRTVSKSGAAAVEAALHSPENNDCNGCTVVPPPCAPPVQPTCVSGHCQ